MELPVATEFRCFRLRECLDRLALLYGFATEHPVPVKSLER